MNLTIEFIAKLLVYAIFSFYMIEYIVKSNVNTALGFIALLIINIILLVIYIFGHHEVAAKFAGSNVIASGANLMT